MRQPPSSSSLPPPDVNAGRVQRVLERFADVALLGWGWLIPDSCMSVRPRREDRVPRLSSIDSWEIDDWH
jgi:hypothetical protein